MDKQPTKRTGLIAWAQKQVRRAVGLETTQAQQFNWIMRGHDDPETRGHDRADERYERLFKEIETARLRDPIVFRSVDYYDKLSLGSGLKLASDNPDILAAATAFWRANNLDAVQHQIAIELATTGNVFVRVSPLSGDDVDAVPAMEAIPNGQIQEIATAEGRPFYYRRRWQQLVYDAPQEGVKEQRTRLIPKRKWMQEDIPAEQMIHTAINHGAGALRGVSMLEPQLFWSALYGRMLETSWAMALARSLVAFHFTVAGSNQEQIDAMIKLIEANLVTRTDPRGMTYKSVGTGQAVVTGEGITMEAVGSDMRAGTADNEIRRVLLMAAVAAGIPEVFLSDGNQANLASSYTQSDPFYRGILSFQTAIVNTIERVYARVFDLYASRKQTFKIDEPDSSKTHVSQYLTIVAPQLLEPNLRELGPVALALVNGGMWSKQYANERMGVEWDTIKKQIVTEKKEGFAPIIQQPGGGPPPPQGGPPNPFQLALSDDPARDDVAEDMNIRRAKLKAALHRYKKALASSGGDQDKNQKAYSTFLKEAMQIIRGVLAGAEKEGAKSVAVPE